MTSTTGSARCCRADVRNQSEYGTVRSYHRRIGIRARPLRRDGTAARRNRSFWDRAFIQFAGFTVGKAQSFYDTVTYGGAYIYHNVRTVSDTGASGWNVWAYTAQFGNGFSATLSLEDPNRGRSVIDNTAAAVLHRLRRSGGRQCVWRRRRPPATASGCRTSSATGASTRPGAMRRRRSPCTRWAAPTTAPPTRGQRPSGRQVGLGVQHRRGVQRPGRSRLATGRQLPVGREARAGYAFGDRPELGDLYAGTQRRLRLGSRRRVERHWRLRNRADHGLERDRLLPARLEPAVAARRFSAATCRSTTTTLRPTLINPRIGGGGAGCGTLQRRQHHRRGLLGRGTTAAILTSASAGRHPHAVEPVSAARYRS